MQVELDAYETEPEEEKTEEELAVSEEIRTDG